MDRDLISLEDVAALFSHAPWTAERRPKDILAALDGSYVIVLAKVEGVPVGVARVVSDGVYRAFVEDVIVHPDYRDRGVGRALVDSLEAVVRQAGIARIELNTQRRGFWEKLGYSVKPDSLYMTKDLDA